MCELMQVREVADIMGCNQQAIRERIKQGIWTFGESYIPEGSKSRKYLIYRHKFLKYIGKEENA